MASHRKPAARPSAAEARASAEAQPMAHDPVKEKKPNDAAPRAGRTGVGARAERPADSRNHRSSDSTPEPTRGGGKPPSPAAKKRGKADADA